MARNAADSAKHLIRVLQQGGVAAENLYNTLTAGKKDLAAQLDRLLMDGASEAELLAFVRSQMAVVRAEGKGQLLDDSLKSSQYQASSTEAFINNLTPDETVAQAYNTSNKAVSNMFSKPIGQKNISVNDLFSGLMTGMSRDVTNITKRAFQEGHTINEIASNIRNGMSDAGDDKSLRRKSEALARTAISKVANETRFEGFMANSDIVDRVLFVATLDGRTSDECMMTDGSLWALEDGNFEKLMDSAKTEEQLIADSKRPEEALGGREVTIAQRADAVTAQWVDSALTKDPAYAKLLAESQMPNSIPNQAGKGAYHLGSDIHMSTYDPDSLLGKSVYRHEFGHFISEKELGDLVGSERYDELRQKETNRILAKQEAAYYRMQGFYPEFDEGGIYTEQRMDDITMNYLKDSYSKLKTTYGEDSEALYLWAEDNLTEGTLARDLFDLMDVDNSDDLAQINMALRLELAQETDIWNNALTYGNSTSGRSLYDETWGDSGHSADLLSALTRDVMGSGHSEAYYDSHVAKIVDGQFFYKDAETAFDYRNISLDSPEIEYGMNTESFANAFALYYDDGSAAGRASKQVLEKISPELYAYMEKLLDKGVALEGRDAF